MWSPITTFVMIFLVVLAGNKLQSAFHKWEHKQEGLWSDIAILSAYVLGAVELTYYEMYNDIFIWPVIIVLLVVGIVWGLPNLIVKVAPPAAKPYEPKPKPLIKPTDKLKLPPALRQPVVELLSYPTDYKVQCVNKLAAILPNHALITNTTTGQKWGKYLYEAWEKDNETHEELRSTWQALGSDLKALRELRIGVTPPRHLRTEHTAIFAASGHGKTQTIQSMILDDLDHAIIVIDSQNQMIDALATRLPPDRLVYIEPQYCPPGLNPFVVAADEQSITEGLSLFEYIAGAIDSQLTGKQQMVYRFAARLCFAIPGATLTTLRQILEGTYDYAPYLHTLDETSRDFLTNQLPDRHYNETKKEIVRRLYQVLGNPTLNRIFSTKTLDLVQTINERKVVLVSTNNAFLQPDGAALLGRLVISEVMKAIRKSTKTAYLYIDEFHEYVSEESTLDQLFRQARKYQLGITVATQELRGLPDKLLNVITANTAIKLAGGLNARDAKQLAADMRVDPHAIQQAPTGTFMLYAKGYGGAVYQTDFGRLEKRPIITPLSAIRERFAPPFPTEDTPIFKAVAEKEGEYGGAGEIERSEW